MPLARAGTLVAELSVDVRRRAADVLLRAVLGQILDQGVFHADLHSGNVVIWPDGQVGLLDFGSVGRLDAPARRNLGLLLWAVDADDPGLATDAVLGLLDHDDHLDERALSEPWGAGSPGARRGNRRQPRLLPAGTEGRSAARYERAQQHHLGFALPRLT